MNKKYVLSALFLLLLTLFSCYKVSDKLEPQINYSVQDRYLKHLPPAFPPLNREKAKEEWGKEYLIGQKFAKELDLYRAITTFKRAEFLLPPNTIDRLQEIHYYILLSYYLGKRYEEVLQTFNHSPLYRTEESFSAYHDLLIILYESYLATHNPSKAETILRIIEYHYPETAKKLHISTAIIEGNLDLLQQAAEDDPSKTYLSNILTTYETDKKSISKAKSLNALFPGAGYLYVGQKQSAITSFLLNGLFIAATIHFFSKGEVAAGIITLSFEAGWYFGGIYGAGQSAKLYNERLYEKIAYPALNQNRLFPILMLRFGF
jgi:hypothetical protein